MHGLASSTTITYRVGHLFCGVGAGARGFNAANPRVRGMQARFVCAGGIDIDAGAIANFEQMTGTPGTVLDLFDRDQYAAWHGKEPPAGWREAAPADIRRAHGDLPLDVMFLSAPCKGFSGLLSSTQSETDKYQALNGLTLRGIRLTLDAYKDDPIRVILFENVPRIATRGRWLLDLIVELLKAYGYTVTETEHDCGELGGLGQSRKRFLLVARRLDSIPNFIYEPEKKRLRGVGEIIGRLPLPGDPVAGPMHRVPRLNWKTWVRLAFVPAGKDWRALNNLVVEDGVLRDYGILPDQDLRDGALGVNAWSDTAPLITGARAPGQGRFSVADPRPQEQWNADVLGVREWERHTGTVPGRSGATNGAHSVADPRPGYGEATHRNVLGVKTWDQPAGVVSGNPKPTAGAHAVADPRVENGHPRSVQLGVGRWDQPAAVVKGDVSVGTGRYAVPDPRLGDRPRFNNTFRIVAYDRAAPAVAGPGGPAGGHAVADPRAPGRDSYSSRKYRVTPYDGASRTVIGASTTGDGAFAVADPRPTHGPNAHTNKMRVVSDQDPAPVITGSDRVGSGALSVADPRPSYGPNTHQNILAVADYEESAKSVTSATHVAGGALSVADPRSGIATDKGGYQTQGHYGVQPWESPSNAVPGFANHDRGKWSVADPREVPSVTLESLPQPNDKLVARIIALDETWHRPFTTLELAALQSFFDPDEIFGQQDGEWFARAGGFDLIGKSDAGKREWIGNAVPSDAATGMATEIGEALLLADLGETFTLSSKAIWCQPLAFAMAIDPRQTIFGEQVQ